MNSVNKIPLRPQNTVAIIFFVQQCSFEFLGLVGRMRVHPLFRLLFGLCIYELYPSLITSHNSVKKFISLFPVVLKKHQGWPHSLSFVKVNQLFCYPPCTELKVTQSVHDNSIQSSPRSLWKLFRKFRGCETTFSTDALVDFERVHQSQLSVVLDHFRHAHQCAHPWIFCTILSHNCHS